MNVSLPTNVMAIAASGMQAALNQFGSAAANIVGDATAASAAPASTAPAPVSASAITAQALGGSDLPSQIVSTIEARNAFMANIAVAKAADDNFKALLGVLA